MGELNPQVNQKGLQQMYTSLPQEHHFSLF